MWERAEWIGVPNEEIIKKKIYQGDMNNRFVYYRCAFSCKEEGRLTVSITANSRYRLWVNGSPVLSGPCRGDRWRQYYETVDLTPYLAIGKNVLAAQVLFCDPAAAPHQGEPRSPLFSVATLPSGHRLAVEGTAFDKENKPLAEVTTGIAAWRVFLDNSYYLICNRPVNENLGAITERIDFNRIPALWKNVDFDDSDWCQGTAIESVRPDAFMEAVGLYGNYRVRLRPIPLLFEQEEELCMELGESVFCNDVAVTVPSYAQKTFLFDGGGLINAYLHYRFAGGKQARVTFTYFEKFISSDLKKHIKRDDYQRGEIGENGQVDSITLSGQPVVYEPFWYRTMRFLSVRVETEKEPLVFFRPIVRKTGYPLNPASFVRSSAPWVQPLWEMCVRTLQDCMMETYMDCPFWEQMQYPMDTRLQALFTYVCSTDTKLARKALEDFHCSVIPDGLVQGKAPSGYPQIISTFSLYYIFMIADFFDRTNEKSVIQAYRADMDGILEYYGEKVGQDGLVGDVEYWPFVDWQPAWNLCTGRPAAADAGPSTVINLMYAFSLRAAARLNREANRAGIAQEYEDRARKITSAVQTLCWDGEKKMYREGPAFQQFSQHAQSWAVLNDMLSLKEAGALMKRSFKSDVLQCGFSTSFELFRACEKSGCYKETESRWNKWIQLINEHCTTCPETPENARSECHAWSALPMYEMIHTMAGIRRKGTGSREVEIDPNLELLPDIEGAAVTEYGMIRFDYRRQRSGAVYKISMPKDLSGTFVYPDGKTESLEPGEYYSFSYRNNAEFSNSKNIMES